MKKIEEIIEIMKEINPEIKMDDSFKKSLKNKLEITSFAKLKNTKNKKINIAESGFFSFRKTNKNIFEKPKINFIKLLSPFFIGAFAVFGFVNFYGNNLFINNGENLNNNSLSTEGFSPLKKVEEIKLQKEVPVLKIKKLSPRTGTDKAIEKKSNNINTEIIDIIGDGEQILNKENKQNFEDKNFVPKFSFDEISNTSVFESVPEIEELNNFIKFCEEKKGIIKNDICEYGENKCSRKDFENKKCDKK